MRDDAVPDMSKVEASVADEFLIREGMRLVWSQKWIVAVVLAAVIALGMIYIRVATPTYTASMIIAPTGGGGPSGLSALMRNNRDIAALAGLSLPEADSVTPFERFIQLTSSATVATQLLERPDIVSRLYAARWSETEQRWYPPDAALARFKQWLKELLGLPPWTPPTAPDIATVLQFRLRIEQLPTSAMMRLSFTDKDAAFAAEFLRFIHEQVDDIVRANSESRTRLQIDYLKAKLQSVALSDQRVALVQLLSDQEKSMMMMHVGLPYAADIVEPPYAPTLPSWPKARVVLLLSAVAGLLIGVLVALLVGIRRRGRSPGLAG